MGTTTAPRPVTLPLGRDSVTYRLALEPFNVVVGGPRALLLQVMHPAVGAGVAQHSDYQRDPWRRLMRTLTTVTQLALGSPENSQRMKRQLRSSHATINGVREDGAPYRALDVENMRWVWATLLDAIIAVADNFVRPLSPADRARLYEEWLAIAEASGVPRDQCPPDIDAFTAYVDEVVEHELAATTTACNIVATIRRPPLPVGLRQPASMLVTLLLFGQLPPRLRRELGLNYRTIDAVAYRAASNGSRLFCALTPDVLRRLPGEVALRGTLSAPPPRPRRHLR
jgi:uncharacterized protein (DUF2236 family)